MSNIVAVGQLTLNDYNDGITVYLSNEGMTLPSDKDGVVTSYTGCSTTMFIFLGTEDDSFNWTVTAAPSTGVTGSFGTGAALRTYTVTGLTENSAYVDFTATKPKTFPVTKRFSLSIAKSGADGEPGQPGQPGGPGAEGTSHVKAYCASSTATTTTSPPTTLGKYSVPPINSGGIVGTWSTLVPSLVSGQYLYVSDGSYNPVTDQVTWGVPYWSSLRVGDLSAVAVNTGSLNVSGTIKSANNKFSVDSEGGVIARSISIQDEFGEIILQAGSPLNPEYAAPGTLNSDFSNGTLNIGGDNLTPNSSFELVFTPPLASGWYVYNNAPSTEPTTAIDGGVGRSGTGRAQAVSWTEGHTSTKGLYGVLCKGGWQPGKTYVISFYAKTTNLISTSNMFLTWNTYPVTTHVIANPNLSTTWQRYVFRITWGATVESNGLCYISVAYGEGAGNVYFDDVMTTEGEVLTAYSTSIQEAKEDAAAAKVAADAANAKADAISSDNILDRSEKASVVTDWYACDVEKASLVPRAADLSVSSTAYVNAHQSLSDYLVSLSPYWSDTTQDTPIDRAVWRAQWTKYAEEKQKLIDAIAAKAATAPSLKLGGRNLYLKTSEFVAVGIPATSQLAARLPTGFQLYGVIENTGVMRLLNVIKKNGTYTISFDLHVGFANGYPMVIDICDSAMQTINPTTTPQHFELTFTVTNWSEIYHFVDFGQLSGQHYFFNNFKLEEGNKATAYTPAPEDVAADISVAGTTAQWSGVNGAGKPADNASADLILVPYMHCSVTGNRASKVSGGYAWDSQVKSKDGFTGAAFASAKVEGLCTLMFGLNRDPDNDASFASIDYAIYPHEGGDLYAYENGEQRGGELGGYAAGDVLAVVYDGSVVRYCKNGVVLYTLTPAAPPTGALYFDSSFYSPNGALSNIRFGPMSSNSWSSIGARPSDFDLLNTYVRKGTFINIDPNFQDASKWVVTQNPSAMSPRFAYNTNASGAGAPTCVYPTGGLGDISMWIMGDPMYPIDPAKTYELSAKIYADGGNDRRFYLALDFFDSVGNRIPSTTWGGGYGGYPVGGVVPTSGSFNRYSGKCGAGTGNAIPSNATQCRVGLILNYGGSSNTSMAAQELKLEDVTAVVAAGKTSTWSGVADRPADSAILNSFISIGADGQLTGGGGGKATLSGMGQKTFRVISYGNAVVGLPASGGLYTDGVLTHGTQRSYALVVIRRDNGTVDYYQTYDVYEDGAVTAGRNAATLAGDLNYFGPDKIVVVFCSDEPKTRRLEGGLPAAMYRCGASRNVFGSVNFKSHSAYILVGIPGCGEGNGAEAYQGSVDQDPNAWCDIGFNVVKGVLTGVSTSYTPKSLTDYGYTGDLNATAGAQAGVNLKGASGSILPESSITNYKYEGDMSIINRPLGGNMSVGGNPGGALCIRIPVGFTNTMMRIKLEVFEYAVGASVTYSLSGYTYESGTWFNTSSEYTGPINARRPVRYGKDSDGYPRIWIGEPGNSWTYPKFSITEVLVGHSYYGYDAWISGWQLSFVTSLPTTIDHTEATPGVGGKMSRIDSITSSNVASYIGANAIGNSQIGGDIFSTHWNGYTDNRMTGWYLERSGNLYGNNVKLKGSIMSGAYYGYDWPATGTGFYLGDSGLLLGNYNTGRYVQFTSDGNMYTPKLTLENGNATFSGSLNAATGTFAGSLSAATGTFSGSLSAAIGSFAGSLSAATGTLGSLHINGGGGIHGGAFTSYAWPAAGNLGFYLGPEGFKVGSGNRYFNADQFGDVYAPNFTIINGVATFSGTLGNVMSVSITDNVPNSRGNPAGKTYCGNLIANISNGRAPYKYSWIISYTSSSPDTRNYQVSLENESTNTVNLYVSSEYNTLVMVGINLNVIDADGKAVSINSYQPIQFGTPQ